MKSITIRDVPEEILNAYRELAAKRTLMNIKKNRVSMNTVLVEALKQYIEK